MMNKIIKYIIISIIVFMTTLAFSNDQLNEFIKKKLEVRKKYQIHENVELFKKIIVGKWAAPLHSQYIIMGNGKFIVMDVYNKKIGEGTWSTNENEFIINPSNSSIQYKYEVDFYELVYSDKPILPFKYTLSIIFKKSIYKAGFELTRDFN